MGYCHQKLQCCYCLTLRNDVFLPHYIVYLQVQIYILDNHYRFQDSGWLQLVVVVLYYLVCLKNCCSKSYWHCLMDLKYLNFLYGLVIHALWNCFPHLGLPTLITKPFVSLETMFPAMLNENVFFTRQYFFHFIVSRRNVFWKQFYNFCFRSITSRRRIKTLSSTEVELKHGTI